MSLLEALILALVQGITEFLPVSSSAHLILLPYLLGWQEHDLRFDVVTNAGTLLAAVFYFRRDLVAACRGLRLRLPGRRRRPDLLTALAVASLPVLLIGFLFRRFFETTARQPQLIAWMSIVFGLLLWWADRRGRRRRGVDELGWGDSVAIGLAQAFALLPGTSRSGVTITAGLALGLRRREAARFSFLLAIPVGVAAFAKDLFDLLAAGLPPGDALPLAVGFVVSAVSAYLMIGWLLAWLRRQTLSLFVVYRLALGVLILLLTWGR